MRKKTKEKLTPLAFSVEPEVAALGPEARREEEEALAEPAGPPAVSALAEIEVDAEDSLFEPETVSRPSPALDAMPAAEPALEAIFEPPPPETLGDAGLDIPAIPVPDEAAAPNPEAPAPLVARFAPPHSKETAAPSVMKKRRRRSADRLPAFARSAYWIAIPASAAWAGCMAAFASGYQNPFGPFEYHPFPMAAFAGLCLLPPVFILLAAYAVRQGAKLSLETRRARALADDLAIPAALAADQAAGASEAAQVEVARAAAAASAAERQLLDLRRALSEESDRLIDATDEAERRAVALTQGLARERDEMNELTKVLDAKVLSVNEAIQAQVQSVNEAIHVQVRSVNEAIGAQVESVNQAIHAQSRLVADTSDLASAHLQEAEAAFAARAADLATTASTVAEITELASDRLGAEASHLEAVSDTLVRRVESTHDVIAAERERLSALAEALHAGQEHIIAQLETQRSDLAAASIEARASAEALSSASQDGAQSLRNLIADVAGELGRLVQAAEADQSAVNIRTKENLRLFTGAVAEERAALEQETRQALEALASAAAQTRQTALEQAAAAREQVEQLGEAAFAAGQKADQAFDTRVTAARRMIEESAGLVEEAGQRSAERIEAGLGATHATLKELQNLLDGIEVKVAKLPGEARERAEVVRHAVEAGIEELSAAARKAAEETQAIDAAFQGRIKQNYQTLSEALRLMGRVAGAADAAVKPAPSTNAPSTNAPSTNEPAITAPAPSTSAPRASGAIPASPILPSASAPGPVASAPRPAAVQPAPPIGGGGSWRPDPDPDRTIRFSPEALIPTPPPPLAPAQVGAQAGAHVGAPALSAAPKPSPSQEPQRHDKSEEVMGLRPRLRLTPDVSVMTEARSVAELVGAAPLASPGSLTPRSEPALQAAAPGEPAPARGGGDWTWKDLLSSIDEPPLDDDVLAERLIAEIEALGLDVTALLPLGRIDEIAAVMQSGDVSGVRDAVRNVAPSAVRRLSRRVLTDRVLRAQADRYLQRYEDLLADSAKRDRDGFVTATLLGSDPGRAFLLFKAAVGELH